MNATFSLKQKYLKYFEKKMMIQNSQSSLAVMV